MTKKKKARGRGPGPSASVTELEVEIIETVNDKNDDWYQAAIARAVNITPTSANTKLKSMLEKGYLTMTVAEPQPLYRVTALGKRAVKFFNDCQENSPASK